MSAPSCASLPATSTIADLRRSTEARHHGSQWADVTDNDDSPVVQAACQFHSNSRCGIPKTPQMMPPAMPSMPLAMPMPQGMASAMPPAMLQAMMYQLSMMQAMQAMQANYMGQVSRNHEQPHHRRTGQADGAKGSTTVCFRNLPNNYNTQMVLDLLDTNGFKNAYDFIYVPHDFKRLPSLVNVGYFFINFVSHEIALRAFGQLTGFKDWALDSHKTLTPAWATKTQGLLACIERYRNSPVMHENIPVECKPMSVENNRLVTLKAAAVGNSIEETRFQPEYKISDGSTASSSEAGGAALDRVSVNEPAADDAVTECVTSADEAAQKSQVFPTLLCAQAPQVKNTFIHMGRSRSLSLECLVFKAVKSCPNLSKAA